LGEPVESDAAEAAEKLSYPAFLSTGSGTTLYNFSHFEE
jgi:hypothetical protein